MRHLDLFSGIGGFALAARRVGWRTIGFCESEPFCQAVLRKHWPDVPIHDDVRTFHGEPGTADVVTGGFPCQDISWAGPGDGIGGARSGLWGELCRIIGEVRPRFAVVENVAALLARGMGVVCGDLARIGYDAEWSTLSACSLGAPHMRRRVLIVAYPNGIDRPQGIWNPFARSPGALQAIYRSESPRARWRARMANPSELYGDADGLPNGLDRNRGTGNAVVPQVAELVFRGIMATSSGDKIG